MEIALQSAARPEKIRWCGPGQLTIVTADPGRARSIEAALMTEHSTLSGPIDCVEMAEDIGAATPAAVRRAVWWLEPIDFAAESAATSLEKRSLRRTGHK